MFKKILDIIIVCLLLQTVILAQNVQKAEYYFDTDPGFGNGILLDLNKGTDASEKVSVNLGSVPTGIHRLYIRAYINPYTQTEDSTTLTKGGWSLTHSVSFYKDTLIIPQAIAGKVSGYEYFFDTDPGFGNGKQQPVPATDDLASYPVLIDLTQVSEGIHNLYVRFKTEDGKWSLTSSKTFYKDAMSSSQSLVSEIVKGEYFFDTDPGFGGGINFPLTAGIDLPGLKHLAGVESLEGGIHTINIRFMDAARSWGHTNSLTFFKQFIYGDSLPADVDAMEYFIDTDPGFGNGTPVDLADGSDIQNHVELIDLKQIANGNHKIYVRARTKQGRWSLTSVREFTVQGSSDFFITPGNVGSIFCAGSPVVIPFTVSKPYTAGNTFIAQLSNVAGSFSTPVNIGQIQGTNSDTIRAILPANTPSGAGYRIRILATSPADTSASNNAAITITRAPNQAAVITGMADICLGQQTYTVNIAGTDAAKYTWELSGGGTMDTTGGNAIVTWTSAGVHALKLTSYNACGTGPSTTLQINAFAAAPSIVPTISPSGNRLYVSTAARAQGVLGYQWYKDGTVLSSATDSLYIAGTDGRYTVRYSNPCGLGPISNEVIIGAIRQSQTITFQPVANKVFGDTSFALSAVASSGLPIIYKIISGSASVEGNIVTIIGAGTVSVQAEQAGNTVYAPATTTRNFIVARATQNVSFEATLDTAKGSYFLLANASSGLPVEFTVVRGSGEVQGNRLVFTGAGEVTVRAVQPGNKNYAASFDEKLFCVAPGQPGAISGFSEVCRSPQVYSIANISGADFVWSLSGGGRLLSATGPSVTVEWTELGTHVLSVKASAPCSGPGTIASTLEVNVTTTIIPGPVTGLYPDTDTLIQSFPFAVSWKPSVNAQFYDLYIWPEGTSQPAAPAAGNITRIGQAVYRNMLPQFAPGKRYNWKVVAKNACRETASPVQTFRVSEVPNLVVQNIEVPSSVFSGQNAMIVVEIKNTGKVDTRTEQWFDAVYFSEDSILDKRTDKYLSGRNKASALAVAQSYRSEFSFNIPENIQGKYYLIVETNGSEFMAETSFEDNISVKALQVNLTPPPDLQVTSLLSRREAFSGQDLELEYTTSNKGTGDTRSFLWNDIVYLSADSVLNVNSAIRLVQIPHRGLLKKDSSYTVKVTVSLPLRTFGLHYLYVVTDEGNQVLEFAFENNNTRQSEPLNIFLAPRPDFIVSQVNASASVTGGEKITVDWFVKNQGAAKPHSSEFRWEEAVFISQESVFNRQTARLLGGANPPRIQGKMPEMNPGDFYNNSVEVTIPETGAGRWYLHVFADYRDEVFEYQRENNNILATSIEIVNPDLVIENIQSRDSALSGSTIPVRYTVRNMGHGKVLDTYRQDGFWLLPTPVFNAQTAIWLGASSYATALDTGSNAAREFLVKLPDTLSGSFYLLAETDLRKDIFEENENNNSSQAVPIHITLSPFPDLVPSMVQAAPDTLVATGKIAVRTRITNAGNKSLTGESWRDRYYLSREPVWNTNRATLIRETIRTQTLMPGDSYEIADSLEISMKLLRDLGIDSTRCYFYVQTDARDDIFEFRGETNNLLRSQPLYLQRGPTADLVVTSVTAADSAYSGKLAWAEWSVTNRGALTGYYSSSWSDGLYLSRDTIFDGSDRSIASRTIYGPVESMGSYTERMSFKIPDGTSGDYYLLLVADQYDANADKDRSNNARVVGIRINRPGDTTILIRPKPIHVTLTPSADLALNAFQAPSIGYAGQPFQIKWQVVNKGVGPTATTGWTERVYLSLDEKVDGYDKVIATYSRKGNLDAGGSYTDSIDAFIPAEAVGNYYVLFNTDNYDVVYEHNAESNNTATSLVFIIRNPPADLIATNIAVPAMAKTGDTITASWTIRNVGQNPATGIFTQGIYISRDSLWDKDDLLLASRQDRIMLPSLGELPYSSTFRVKGLAAGRHFILVRADLGNNIYEQDEENNVGASGELQISVPDLPLNIVTSGKLVNNDELYYKIAIPDSLSTETLLVSLKADSALNTVNELYLKYGSFPTRSSYDFAYSKALSASQDVVIPDLRTGTYYLLVYGRAKIQPQTITLLAKKINFEIHEVITNKGGNTGTVTVKVTGARFENNMQITLFDETLGTIAAHAVSWKNSTTLFATFNLEGVRSGSYDLRLVKPAGQSATLREGFEVVTGSGGSVAGSGTGGGFYCTIQNIGVEDLASVHVDHPDRARIMTVFPMVIKYGNSGNVDVPVQTRTLVCLNGTPVSLTTEEIVKALKEMDRTRNWNELLIEFSDPDGIPGILRPQATGSIIIYASAFGAETLTFRLLE